LFKAIKQLGAILILSLILITFANTAFADEYSDCVAKYSSEENTMQCDDLQLQYQDCVAQANQNVKTQCETFESEFITQCSNTKTLDGFTYLTESECLSALQTKIDDCIKKQTPTYLEVCASLNTQVQNCLNQNTALIDQMCGSLKAGGTTTTKAPSIPNIKTLPGPQASDVSNVSPYLMSTFLPRVARTVISFAIGAAVLGLILSAIGLLTAYGNEEKYGNAKKGLYFSLIGLVLSLLAFAIVQLIFFTGFQIGNIT
jgi:hypothetical protein